ncbi:MAG: hypothetical protein QHH80_13900 [Anaerolineae bacterium]|jgi:hypothetical protein|nr:hypothetical protein [Anaerolineae bacterium]
MPRRLELVLMTGGEETSPEETMMTEAWRAATLDWLDRAARVDAIGRVVVATNSEPFSERIRAAHPDAEIALDRGAFHFGRRLRDLVTEHGLAAPFYAGGGSGVFLAEDDLRWIAETVANGEKRLVANNFYSSDLVAFTPGDAIHHIEPPDTDNDLAWRLARQAGLEALALPPSAVSLFDLDTPVDLMICMAHPACPLHLRAYLDSLDLDPAPVVRALDVLRRPGARILLAGRVGAAARAYMEEHTPCTVMALAEERGMRASGRMERGEVRTVLGFFMRERGPRELFRTLADVADLVLLDSRVLLSHLGRWPTNTDRYRSDLLRPAGIADPALKALTEAAADAPIPVLLGGHSLVSGGLYALVDMARGMAEPQDRE